MTVSSTTTKAQYSGNGVTTVFAVPFYFLQNADLLVILRSAAGAETTQAINTNYTVTGAGNENGGSITMTVAPPTGTTLTILRNAAATQETDLLPNDRLPAESLETALDKLTMLSQQLEEEVTRSLKYPATDSSISAQIPNSITRANKFLSFDASGAPNTLISVEATPDIFVQSGTGAVPRSVNTKLRETFSVKDFGAVGDGVTDDTINITKALEALVRAGGGTLYFPPGTYIISAGIPLVGKVHYKGAGKNNTTIKQSSWDAVIGMGYFLGIEPGHPLYDDTTIPPIIRQSASQRLNGATITRDYWTISGLTLDGNASPSGIIHKDDAFGNVIRMELHAYGVITDCNIINSWNQAISVYFYSNNIAINNCFFKNIGQPGGTAISSVISGPRLYTGNAIFVEFSSRQTVIESNLFEGIDQRCVWYTCAGERPDDSQRDHVFANNICHYSGSTSGAEVLYNGTYSSGYERVAGPHGITITGNRFVAETKPSPSYGITVINATSVTVDNNYIYNREYGVYWSNSRGTIANNIFHTCTISSVWMNFGGATTQFKPTIINSRLINTPREIWTSTANGIPTSSSILAFGNNSNADRSVAAGGGTVTFALNQGDAAFDNADFTYRCVLQLNKDSGNYAMCTFQFYVGRGFNDGAGFYTNYGATALTAIIDQTSLIGNFAVSFNNSTKVLTVTNNDATNAYKVALFVEAIPVRAFI